MLDKEFWYDWGGLNQTIFKCINGFHDDSYDMVMGLASNMADKHNLGRYIFLLIIWVAANFIYKKIRSSGGSNQYLVMWFGAFMVLGASMLVSDLVVHALKEYFAFPRPYVVLGPQDVHMLEYAKTQNYTGHDSFPSGHATFITVLVISLWPVLSQAMRWVGVLLIPLVCLSRIAAGVHFPADVIAGFLISLIITVILRMVIYRILLRFRMRC